MYGFKTKYSKRLKWILGGLRVLSLFFILLLIINPKFSFESYTAEKPSLSVLIDNSFSIAELEQEQNTRDLIETIEQHRDLNSKFNISYFSFGNDFDKYDSLSFDEKNSNHSKALKESDGLFSKNTPTLFITDGNQTLGSDYEFQSRILKNPVYPIVLGDTTSISDIKIEQLNTNRYAFLKNQFPVEVMLLYNGDEEINSNFNIYQGNTIVYSETFGFNKLENFKTLSFTLPANSVGLKRYRAEISPLNDEKNTINNSKQFAVEVIDESTNILIVSNKVHPDLGMLKKSIETNEQRKVTLVKPQDALTSIADSQLIILYQPDRSFTAVHSKIKELKINTLLITGVNTDWDYLNEVQNKFLKEYTNQSEDVAGDLNFNYGAYSIEDIGFEDFPPLKSDFGALSIMVPHDVIFDQTINGFNTESPLLVTTDIDGQRESILDGEGIWRWRSYSYISTDSFMDFDEFLGKLIQYLSSNKRRSRLEVDSKTFYYNNDIIRITAQYFDKNFVFDPRGSLSINVTNSVTGESFEFPLLLKRNYYTVDLNSLPSGDYNYTVSVNDDPVSRSGSFSILEFNVEQQFLNADVTKLQRTATNTGGKSFLISESESLLNELVNDEQYRTIQKSEQKIVPLIDWKYLLVLIVITLTLEWFIRKYNGLI
jgi:hypothetical protein